MKETCCLTVVALAAVALMRSAAAEPRQAGPSFDCRYAKSYAEKTVCADPELADLDRMLAETFLNTSNQGGIDAKSLRAGEDHWLADIRDRCASAECLKTAYTARNAALLDQSLRAASPAAYAETRPYPAPPALWGEARALIGKSCADAFSPASGAFPGFDKPSGFLPIVVRDGYVVVRSKAGTRFAFLLENAGGELAACRIADVVTLPPPAVANAFLQCSIAATDSHGFGMRLAGSRKVVAYWEVDIGHGQLTREPLGVLGADDTIRCTEPETGE